MMLFHLMQQALEGALQAALLSTEGTQMDGVLTDPYFWSREIVVFHLESLNQLNEFTRSHLIG